jgi:PhnB protein
MIKKLIREGFTTVTPYLIVRGAAQAIEFYKRAFGAIECRRMEADGKIMHAEIKIGNAHIMLAEEFPGHGFHSPQSLGGSSAFVHLYVDDVDARFKQALDVGAKILQSVSDQFFGDRHGLIQDPFGYTWTIATHIEDVSSEEIQRRIKTYRNTND